MTLIVDAMHELVDDLARVEDWLRWADCDSEEAAQLLGTAAEQAGSLGMALRASLAATPVLYSPSDLELADVAPLPSEAVLAAHSAIAAAVQAASPSSPEPPSFAVVALLGICLAQDGTADALALATVLNGGGGGGRWLALIGEDSSGDRDEAIGTGERRWATRLTEDEFAAYRRFVSAVVGDPLARFAAFG